MLPFDPEDLDLQQMPHTYSCGAFTCGNSAIDHALRNDLLIAIAEGRNKGYYLEYHGSLVAFTSLRAATFEIDPIDREHRAITSRHVSGIRIELVGIATQYQRGGVGTRLMEEIAAIAAEVAQRVGARFLAVESLPSAQKFYTSLGFTPTQVQPPGTTIFMVLDLMENDEAA